MLTRDVLDTGDDHAEASTRIVDAPYIAYPAAIKFLRARNNLKDLVVCSEFLS